MAIGIINAKMHAIDLSEKPYFKSIPAIVNGDWGIHLSLSHHGYTDGCSVTHIPSGFFIRSNLNFAEASRLAQKLIKMKYKWNGKDEWPKIFETTVKKIASNY